MQIFKVVCLLIIAWVAMAMGDEAAHGEDNAGEHDTPHWAYHGRYDAAHWNELFSLCSRDSPRQSPIDIVSDDANSNDQLTNIELNEVIDQSYTTMKITNNGHGVNVEVPHETFIIGGGLPSQGYRIAGLHFHWGSVDGQGSEHTVNEQSFPLEMHMVSYDTARFPALGDAIFAPNALAVLGTMFQISPENNTLFDPIIAGLRNVKNPDDQATITHFNLGRLLPKNTNMYYRYQGSLTTPPCAETVIWTLFLHTQSISSAQMTEFRQLMETPVEGQTGHIQDNWRPVQPLQGRQVYRSFLLQSEITEQVGGPHGSATLPSLGASAILATLLARFL